MRSRQTTTIVAAFALPKNIGILGFCSIILMLTSCQNNPAETEEKADNDHLQATSSNVQHIHLALSGGGWRTHTAHSAWTISLLEGGNKKLNDIFKNVGVVSSNSGGSWFSTMLMYSPEFVSDIEAKDAANKWTSTGGWIGKQRTLFDNAGCNLAPDGVYLECVFDTYTGKHITGGAYWRRVVESLIYKDYPLGRKTLGSDHLPWAKDKPLLLASSLLTNSVVLNRFDWEDYKSYYQACIYPNKPILQKDKGSHCSNGIPADVTPVTFSSIPSHLKYSPSPFLAELETDERSSTLNLGYTVNYMIENAPQRYTQLSLPLNNSDVAVISSAAASSAAAGFIASEGITGNFELSYEGSEDALSFSLANSQVEYIEAQGISLDKLSDKKIVRLADGGPIDNSGVAQLVRSLQLNNIDDDFEIVAFDNVTEIIPGNQNQANVGVDIASLFGHPDPFCVKKFCVTTPDLQIFESLPLRSSQATWSYQVGDNQLIYTKYNVKTKENPILGIKAGTKGTLHSFTCYYPSADTAPVDGDKNFDTYSDMFYFIIQGLNHDHQKGLKYLKKALEIQ